MSYKGYDVEENHMLIDSNFPYEDYDDRDYDEDDYDEDEE